LGLFAAWSVVVLRLFNKASAGKGRIGLSFGANQIAVAVTRRDSTGPVLERCELLPLSPAAGANAPGLAIQAAALPRMPVSAVLTPDEYQLALVEAPEVPPAELRAAMRWRLKDTIDFKVEEAVIDVFDIPEQNRGGNGRMMYAIAARRSAVDRYAGALAGVSSFDVIDVPELCLRNLAGLLPAAAAGVALLHLGETRASVVLVRGKTFYLSRQMDLAKAAGPDRSRAAGARAERGENGRIDPGAVVLELQRSLDYYERHFDQPPITRIALSPMGPLAMDLAQELGRETGFEVMTLDLNTLLSCATPIAPESQAACLLAVGAALREEHRSL
jgi:MSHA biogenesis protein MshI